MKRFVLAAGLAVAALSVHASAFAQSKGPVVGVSWSNFQEERWKTDEAAIKAVLATLGRPGWQDENARMMVGVAMRQQRGAWDTTTSNAWGTILARKFAGLYPAEAITTSSLSPDRRCSANRLPNRKEKGRMMMKRVGRTSITR